MGILDDAIREHLELKRQHGAADDDVERLEKEAFGPPTRPGDPEFDTSEAEVTSAAADAGAPAADAGPPSTAPAEPAGDQAVAPGEPARGGLFDVEAEEGPAEPAPEAQPEEEEDWLASLEDVVEQPAAEPTGAEPASAPEADAGTTSPIEDLTPAERARIEHPHLDDTVDHPAIPEPGETGEQAAAPPPPETGEDDAIAPPEPPESAIFDGEDEAEFGDLDLELDDTELDEPETRPEPSSFTTSTEMDALPPPPAPAEPITGEEDEYVADDAEEDELEDEDEDLLEETPDFLQDAPEGERLWFEQGAPKDFDFDDEEDEDD